MKKLFFTFMTLLIIFSMVGCSEESEKDDGGGSGTSQDFGDGNDNGDGDNGDGDNGGGTTSNTNNCAGTKADGTGDGVGLHIFKLMLAGGQDWVPGENYNKNEVYSDSTMSLNLLEHSLLFASDSKLQVRFKVLNQPFPAAGEEYCFGRSTGMAADQFNYTKLRFMIALRDIKCDVPDQNNPSQCESGFYLGERYGLQRMDPIEADSCSDIIEIGSLRNPNPYGTTVEILNVQSDSTCQANDTHCPADDRVRSASCWDITMQVSTDYTQSFKN